MKIGTLKTLHAFGETHHNLSVRIAGSYQDGTPAINVYCDDGSQWSRLTVCVPGAKKHLGEGEVLVKTWSENEPTANALRNSDLFEDTGKRIQTGFVMAEIWKIKTRG